MKLKRERAKLLAKAGRYFFLPCPMCGQEFAGFEWGQNTRRGERDSIPTSTPACGVGVCPDCVEWRQHEIRELWRKRNREIFVSVDTGTVVGL